MEDARSVDDPDLGKIRELHDLREKLPRLVNQYHFKSGRSDGSYLKRCRYNGLRSDNGGQNSNDQSRVNRARRCRKKEGV